MYLILFEELIPRMKCCCFIPTLKTREHPLPVPTLLPPPHLTPVLSPSYSFPWMLKCGEAALLGLAASHHGPHWLCSSPTFYVSSTDVLYKSHILKVSLDPLGPTRLLALTLWACAGRAVMPFCSLERAAGV